MATKRKASGKADSSEASGAKAYRHTRTGAIRFSTTKLGFPFEEVDTKVEKAADSKEEGAE